MWGGRLIGGADTGCAAQRCQCFIDQRIIPPCLDPAHAAQNGRGGAPFGPCKRPDRHALLNMAQVKPGMVRQPGG